MVPLKMGRTPIRISSSPTIEMRAGQRAGQRWMALLESIGTTRSISAAANAIGLSYKAAWDAVEAMNNLSDTPLVLRVKGGKGGGGTSLTARGKQLVATYRVVETENSRFLGRLNARIKNLNQDLHMIGKMTLLTSARNHFSGKVVRIKKGAVNDEVVLRLPGGDRLVAVITHESVETLGLKRGSEAVALVKASWVIVATDSASRLKLSARNQLKGTVGRLIPGAVNTEVVIALKGQNSVAAIITNESARTLGLAVGRPATAVFKASSVILGVSA
ncbi:MAG: TOBE domain-containing protein [Nevskiales bacterium]|nr:TOBE domain-containing protein [Nevskiales bacterium]